MDNISVTHDATNLRALAFTELGCGATHLVRYRLKRNVEHPLAFTFRFSSHSGNRIEEHHLLPCNGEPQA